MPAQTNKKKLMWVRGVVCRSTQTQSLTVVACVILQCIPCFYECRCMSDGVFIQFVSIYNLMVVQIKVCQRFVCVVFLDFPRTLKNAKNNCNILLDCPHEHLVSLRTQHRQLVFPPQHGDSPTLYVVAHFWFGFRLFQASAQLPPRKRRSFVLESPISSAVVCSVDKERLRRCLLIGAVCN